MSEMSNDEIRLAIAKAKGWKLYKMDFSQIPDSFYTWRNVLKLPGRSAPTCDDERCIITELDLSADAAMLKSMAPDWPISIAAAWGLVEEMGTAFMGLMPAQPLDNWMVTCSIGGWGYNAFGDTAPRAICLAYLAWKGV